MPDLHLSIGFISSENLTFTSKHVYHDQRPHSAVSNPFLPVLREGVWGGAGRGKTIKIIS